MLIKSMGGGGNPFTKNMYKNHHVVYFNCPTIFFVNYTSIYLRGEEQIKKIKLSMSFFWILFFVFCFLGGGKPAAYGDSQARGLIGAVAACLHPRHSNARSKPHMQPTPQLTAMLDT